VVDSFEALYKKLNHLTQMTSDDRMLSKKELFSLLEQVLNQMDQLRNEYTKLAGPFGRVVQDLPRDSNAL